MSGKKTRHLLAARHMQSADHNAVLVANLETNTYIWEASVEEAVAFLEGRRGPFKGCIIDSKILWWLRGGYKECFTKIVLG